MCQTHRGQLAGGGDGGDLGAAEGADAGAEGMQRPGRVRGGPGGFDQQPSRDAAALFGDAAVLGRSVAGLADGGIEAELVAHRCPKRALRGFEGSMPRSDHHIEVDAAP
jgi:hypothetical protein